MDTRDTSQSPGPPQMADPFSTHLGIRAVTSAEGVGRVAMPIAEHHRQGAGVVQGGLLVALADQALYLAVRSRLGPGESSVTVEIKVNFLAPAREGELTATARLISRGRRIAVGNLEVVDQTGTLIAQGMGTCLVRSPRE